MQSYTIPQILQILQTFAWPPGFQATIGKTGLLPLILDCIENSKTLSKPLAYAAVCIKNPFQNCISVLEYFYFLFKCKKSELLKSNFWPWKYILGINIDLEYLQMYKITYWNHNIQFLGFLFVSPKITLC